SAWIHSIHRGIDVARGLKLPHIAGATGAASEKATMLHHGLPEVAMIDMGDFVGGMLKYIRAHPVERVTVAGGVAKMTKLAHGMLALPSKRGSPAFDGLATLAEEAGAHASLIEAIKVSNTVAQAFGHAAAEKFPLGNLVAERAWETAATLLRSTDVAL